jgi:predicted PurR-regulated permease PerM
MKGTERDAESWRTPRITPPARPRAGAIALGALAAGGIVAILAWLASPARRGAQVTEQDRDVEAAPPASIVPLPLYRAGAIAWRVLAVVALLAILVYLAFLLGTVTASILISLIVAATFAPVTRNLRARGWSRAKAAAVVTTAAVVVAGVVIALVVIAFVPYVDDIVTGVQNGVVALRAELQQAQISPEGISAIEDAVAAVREWIAGQVAGFAGAVASGVTVGILSLFLTYYVLADGDNFWNQILKATDERHRADVESSGWDALERVGGYLRGTAILAGFRAIVVLALLFLFDVPLAAPLAVLVFLGGFIPYIGPLVATLAVLLAALATVGLQTTILIFLLLGVATVIQTQLLRPFIYGRSIHLHPFVILTALPIAGYVAGMIGLFAALPVIAFAVAIGGTLLEVLEPPVEDPSRLVSGWLDRVAQWSWRALAIIGVVAVVITLTSQVPLVIIPIIAAAVIAATIAPLSSALQRRGWSASRAAATVTGGTFLLLLAVVIVAVIQLAGPLIDSVRASMDGAQQANATTSGDVEALIDLVATVGGAIVGAIGTVAGAVSALAVILLLSPILAFYLLRDAPRGWAVLTARATPWRRAVLNTGGTEATEILGGYMLGTAAISAVGAISQYLIMVLLGLPFAIPIAILSFIACFIPYIGGFVTTGLAFLIAVAYGEPPQIVIMFIYTIVFNLVQGNIVTPLVYSRAGIAGMFLIVPILAVIQATWRSVVLVLGNEPAAPKASVDTMDAAAGAVLVPKPAD